MPKMSIREVEAILKAEKTNSLGGMEASKLTDERSKGMDYYLGEMTDMPVTEDERSSATTSDVSDVVESLMPTMMEIFCGGDEVAEFNPVGGEKDEDLAAQETDYVNHVFMQKNPGFLILYSMIKDAMLSKNGIVKVFWEEREEQREETFYGLPDAAYGLLMMKAEEEDSKIEIVEHTERQGIPGEQPQEEAYV